MAEDCLWHHWTHLSNVCKWKDVLCIYSQSQCIYSQSQCITGIPGLPTFMIISQAVHFTVWISADTGLMVQVMPISYLQGRMRCDVGNGHQIVLTTEEGCIFMRLNRIHINCVSKGWWHQASIKAVSDSEITNLLTIGVPYDSGNTHLQCQW